MKMVVVQACQVADWKGSHKEECKAITEAAKKNGGAVPDTPVRALGRLVWLKAKDVSGSLSKEIDSLQSHSNRATALLITALDSLTSLTPPLSPSSYPLLSLRQALFPLLLSLPPNFIPSPLTIATQINLGLSTLQPYPHPTKAIALASAAKLRVALLHPADEVAFWQDIEAVKRCLVELKTAVKEVKAAFGSDGGGVVSGELRDLIESLEEGMGRANYGV
ncbi:hypothetical protein P7C70_g283, partial [Phenoliferia sp. Uapishka_3]